MINEDNTYPIALVNSFNTTEVNVEDCVSALGVERRRMYDVVNILESF
jgi:E2F/DP family winged-helix DNA-binding domain